MEFLSLNGDCRCSSESTHLKMPHCRIPHAADTYQSNVLCRFDQDLHQIKLFIQVFLDFSLTVKAATLIFISGCGSAISSAKGGNSGFI